MKYLILFFVFMTTTMVWGQDIIYLKNGDIIPVKVNKSSDEGIFVNIYDEGRFGRYKLTKETTTYNPSDIYMIKYQSRGNLYFLDSSTRKQGENQKIDKSANVIYLVEGKEIPAWEIQIQGSEIRYRQTKEKKQALSNTQVIDADKVFMICYTDGSKDIITDLSKSVSEEVSESVPKEEIKEEPQIKVIFHTVKANDTLVSIANQYTVSVSDLRSWNDIPTTTKDTTKLKVGQQLLIQQPIE